MKKSILILLIFGTLLGSAGYSWSAEIDPKEIVTLLPPDAIPAILKPKHTTISEAESAGLIVNGNRVLGVSINGESRAYPIKILSVHEIANDLVGGLKIAITW